MLLWFHKFLTSPIFTDLVKILFLKLLIHNFVESNYVCFFSLWENAVLYWSLHSWSESATKKKSKPKIGTMVINKKIIKTMKPQYSEESFIHVVTEAKQKEWSINLFVNVFNQNSEIFHCSQFVYKSTAYPSKSLYVCHHSRLSYISLTKSKGV